MSGYTINNGMAGSLQAMTTTYKTLILLANANSGTAKRFRVTEIEMSASSVPNATDCQVLGTTGWCSGTATGTSTAGTPFPRDNGTTIGTQVDTAVSTPRLNFSAEPTALTYTQSWWLRGFNQRSGVLWQAAPGHEIILPAVLGGANGTVGMVLQAQSTNYAGNVPARLDFDEL